MATVKVAILTQSRLASGRRSRLFQDDRLDGRHDKCLDGIHGDRLDGMRLSDDNLHGRPDKSRHSSG